MSANDTAMTTRGGALKRLLLVAGGAVGVGVAGSRTLGRRDEAAAVPAGAGSRTTDVVLYGRDWRIGSHAARPGKRPSSDEQRTPKGRIVDAAGRELGTFKAANLLGYGGALQLQTFDLVDGTIVGIGAPGIHENPFAIVGGTGSYAGASGTYVARQAPRELGGDGTAEFALTLTARGGA
jgi:hypothetical protein